MSPGAPIKSCPYIYTHAHTQYTFIHLLYIRVRTRDYIFCVFNIFTRLNLAVDADVCIHTLHVCVVALLSYRVYRKSKKRAHTHTHGDKIFNRVERQSAINVG